MFEADLTLLKNILKLKHKTIKKRSTKMLNFRLLAFLRANMAKVQSELPLYCPSSISIVFNKGK